MSLTVADLSFGYTRHRGASVVSDWSYRFEPGMSYAVTGPSGCGKSTRLYLLGLMMQPTSGSVSIDGQRVDDQPDSVRAYLRATKFGFVFQDAQLDARRSVLDNVVEATTYASLDRTAACDRARALLDRYGVAVPIDRRPGQISGGQAQRVALCRALLTQPQFILADEPTGNLDPASAQVVLDGLREAADLGSCVIVVTHDPVVVEWADRVLLATAVAPDTEAVRT